MAYARSYYCQSVVCVEKKIPAVADCTLCGLGICVGCRERCANCNAVTCNGCREGKLCVDCMYGEAA